MTILTTFKCTVRWPCCAATTVRLQILCLVKWKLSPLNTRSPPLPLPWCTPSTRCLQGCDSSWGLMGVEPCRVHPFVAGCFPLHRGLSVHPHRTARQNFLLFTAESYSTELCSTFCSSIHPLMDTRAVSTLKNGAVEKVCYTAYCFVQNKATHIYSLPKCSLFLLNTTDSGFGRARAVSGPLSLHLWRVSWRP